MSLQTALILSGITLVVTLLLVLFIERPKPPATIYRHTVLRVRSDQDGAEIFAIERDGTMILKGRVIGRDKEVADVLMADLYRGFSK